MTSSSHTGVGVGQTASDKILTRLVLIRRDFLHRIFLSLFENEAEATELMYSRLNQGELWSSPTTHNGLKSEPSRVVTLRYSTASICKGVCIIVEITKSCAYHTTFISFRRDIATPDGPCCFMTCSILSGDDGTQRSRPKNLLGRSWQMVGEKKNVKPRAHAVIVRYPELCG